MYIHRIKIKNFKSIYDELDLNFDDIKGFWRISGPVGAGKTSIGEAIIFGLFGTVYGKNNGDLISWGEKHSLIETWCTSKGKNIYIKREINTYGQSPIYVEIDGEELVFTNKKHAQQQLEKDYYDTTRASMEMLCIISFNNFRSITTMNTGDTKKFLDQVLGFYILTNYADICKDLKNQNLNKISETKNVINKLQSQINKLNEIFIDNYEDSDEKQLLSEIKEIEYNIGLYKNSKNREIKVLQDKFNSKKNEQTSLLTLGKSIKKEIDFIEKGICPTCGAHIDQSKLQEKKLERQKLLECYNDIIKELDAIQNELQQATNEYNTFIDSQNNIIKDKEKELIIIKESLKRTKITDNEINNIKKDLQKYTEDYNKYLLEDTDWNKLYNLLSTKIRAEILNSFIPHINQNIQKYSAELQQPYIINFDENFKCNIQLYGYKENIPLSSLSTGQLKIVDMIVILGILGTIINSSTINIMFLDELFSNLDDTLRNEMCKVLKENVNGIGTLFIVSHQYIDDHYFDGNINININSSDMFKKVSNIDIKKGS